jgi:hypothetical protein
MIFRPAIRAFYMPSVGDIQEYSGMQIPFFTLARRAMEW